MSNIEEELAAITIARGIEAQRVTGGYTTEELRQMPTNALAISHHHIRELTHALEEMCWACLNGGQRPAPAWDDAVALLPDRIRDRLKDIARKV